MGGGGVEKWRLKLTSAKVVVEVESELGKSFNSYFHTSVPEYSKTRPYLLSQTWIIQVSDSV